MWFQILGLVIVVVAMGISIVFLFRGEKVGKAEASLLGIMMLVGFGIMLLDRITEFKVIGIGTIKAATAQASVDAGTIQALKTRVENQSATVDAVAAQAKNAADLSDKAGFQVKAADQKLADLNATLSAAKVTLEKLQKDADFGNLIEQAQNDDRIAFDKLSLIAKDASSPYAKRAATAQNVIVDAHSQGIYETNLQLPWQNGVEPDVLSFSTLKSIFGSIEAPLKPALIEYINNRRDIPKNEKLDFFIEVMKTDASLKAVEYAGRYFTMDINLKIKPLAIDYLSNWWSEHRWDYENPELERN